MSSAVQIPALLSYREQVYRPAGYRVPHLGERYVASTGHIKKCNGGHIPGPRLIVRPYSPADFGGVAALER